MASKTLQCRNFVETTFLLKKDTSTHSISIYMAHIQGSKGLRQNQASL
jgi:hypothetical protein